MGSKFTFEIRLEPCQKPEPGHSDPAPETNSNAEVPEFEGVRVLLAEDIEINRIIFESLLDGTGLQVDSVSNGEEAVRAFGENPEKYDMIFMDIQMPVLDGLEAAKAIRAMEIRPAKSVPIIAMTANVLQEDVDKSISAGMNGHLGKPIEVDQVFKILRHYTKPE